MSVQTVGVGYSNSRPTSSDSTTTSIGFSSPKNMMCFGCKINIKMYTHDLEIIEDMEK
jgi:hypothetical protein